MISIKGQQVSVSVNWELDRPIFDWQTAPIKFMEGISKYLGEDLHVKTSDFSMQSSSLLSDVSVSYRIFGGTSKLTLFSDRLSLDVPLTNSTSSALIISIIKQVDENKDHIISDRNVKALATSVGEHFEAKFDGPINIHLEKLQNISLCDDDGWKEYRAIKEPSVKFNVRSADQKWSANFYAEPSYIVQNGVFVFIQARQMDQDILKDFDSKVRNFAEIYKNCLKMIGMAVSNE